MPVLEFWFILSFLIEILKSAIQDGTAHTNEVGKCLVNYGKEH